MLFVSTYLKIIIMKIMKKEVIKIIVKVLIYALCLLGSYLGISGLTSCSTSHAVEGCGKTTILTTDTTFIYHNGVLKTK